MPSDIRGRSSSNLQSRAKSADAITSLPPRIPHSRGLFVHVLDLSCIDSCNPVVNVVTILYSYHHTATSPCAPLPSHLTSSLVYYEMSPLYTETAFSDALTVSARLRICDLDSHPRCNAARSSDGSPPCLAKPWRRRARMRLLRT
jgi:hypothetical protein